MSLPSLFTSLNLFSGLIAIILAINGHPVFSSWMIIIAVLLDGLDGKIARWANCETKFGLQLDSFADLISSGIAPMVLMYHLVFKHMPWPYTWICLLFVFAGTYRLARFNVMQKGDRSHGYLGLPIPVAGMSLAAFCLFLNAFSLTTNWLFVTLLMLLLSLLMMSAIPYAWPKLEWQQGRLRIGVSVVFLLGVCGMIVFTKYTLFPMLCLYVITGIARLIIKAIREVWVIDILK